MKIKELFNKMEKANQFAKMVGDEARYELEVAICEEQYFDWYYGKSFSSFKDFQKYCKEEYIKGYQESFIDVEIEMDNEGNGEGHFIVVHWWKGVEEKHIIKVHIWRKR